MSTAVQQMSELIRDMYNTEGGRQFAVRLEKIVDESWASREAPQIQWMSDFNHLLDDYAGAMQETAVFNVTQLGGGKAIRMPQPRYRSLIKHVESVFSLVPPASKQKPMWRYRTDLANPDFACRYFVESDSPGDHDVRLYINGNFADDAQRGVYGRLLETKLNGLTTKVPTTPPPELTWIYTHCRDIGMDCKSDSGKWEHDIALFTSRQKEKIEELERRAAQPKSYQPLPTEVVDDLIRSTPSLVHPSTSALQDFAEQVQRLLIAALPVPQVDAKPFAYIARQKQLVGEWSDWFFVDKQTFLIQTAKPRPYVQVKAVFDVPQSSAVRSLDRQGYKCVGYVGTDALTHLAEATEEELPNSIRLYNYPNEEREITLPVFAVIPQGK